MMYSGKVGLVKHQVQTEPGVYRDKVEEVPVRGSFTSLAFSQRPTNSSTNDTTTISNQISILASPKLISGMGDIRWVTVAGVKWKVQSVNIWNNRLQLTLSEVYNGS